MGVELGFLDDTDSWLLSSRFFPSKVGGKPAWLDLKNIPNSKNLECKNCGKPCIFLCQVYAPYEDNPLTFHRTIFVFICRDYNCCKNNSNINLRVLRSQLSRENEFYPANPPIEYESWRTDIDATKYGPTCRVCFLSAPCRCAKCKSVHYCCKHHQVLDWKAGHKTECCKIPDELISQKSLPIPNLLFLEYDIDMEPEADKVGADVEESEYEKEQKEIAKFKLMMKNGQIGSLADVKDEELEKMAVNNDDETFMEFQDRVKKHPEQILRYERGGSPLLISSRNTPTIIPKCKNCNGERQFEFQIMPQLLNELNFNDVLKSLDWGILAVYTCKDSCEIESGYREEFIWKQDIE